MGKSVKWTGERWEIQSTPYFDETSIYGDPKDEERGGVILWLAGLAVGALILGGLWLKFC